MNVLKRLQISRAANSNRGHQGHVKIANPMPTDPVVSKY
jgi:hypothetical protein